MGGLGRAVELFVNDAIIATVLPSEETFLRPGKIKSF